MAERHSARSVDMEMALLDPGSVFPTPEDVLNHRGLTEEQKIEILRRWEYDAAEVSVAVEEGMPGNDNGLMRRILLALEELTGGMSSKRALRSRTDYRDRPSSPRSKCLVGIDPAPESGTRG